MKNHKLKSESKSDHFDANIFIQLSDLLNSIGVNVKPFVDDSGLFFASLDENVKTQAIETAREALYNIEATIEKNKEGENFNLNQLWIYLTEKRLEYPIDLFNNIKKNDIIEIYNLENKQVFRSFEFFRYCNYTFDELFTTPWSELYYREPKYLAEYMRILSDLYQSNSSEIYHISTVPPHWVCQIRTPKMVKHFLKSKISCLLFDRQQNVIGYVHTQQILNDEGKVST